MATQRNTSSSMTRGIDRWRPVNSWAGYQENFVDAIEPFRRKVSHLSALMTRKDPQTAMHQQRVAQLSARIALKMHLPAEQVAGVWLSA